jgi:LysR family transcriptional regulator, low CO2-responsive transcriptional regulator
MSRAPCGELAITPVSNEHRFFDSSIASNERAPCQRCRGTRAALRGVAYGDETSSCMRQPLDTRQLRAFVTLAKRGSFTQAAKELHLSQSAVSHSMKALETDLGCRLFDRMSKKVLLTQAGEALLQHADKIMLEMMAARDSIEQLSKWGRGRLRIGASTTACQYILPEVLSEFKKAYPQAHIAVEPGDTREAMQLLRNNQIDLAVTLEPKRDDDFEFVSLFSDEMFFVLAPSHPWAQAGRVVREEIPTQHYVLYSKNSFTFELVTDYFREEDMVLNTVMELGSMEAIKELVKLGLGVSILAPWVAAKEIERGELVGLSLGKRKLKRTWGVLHWRGRRLSLAEETFVKLCKQHTTKLTP